jgi:hypothetical protein
VVGFVDGGGEQQQQEEPGIDSSDEKSATGNPAYSIPSYSTLKI